MPLRVGEIEQRRLDLLFLRQSVTLQLDIEPVAEQPQQPLAARRRKLGLARRDREVERAAGTAGQRDQAVGAASSAASLRCGGSPDGVSRKAREVSRIRLR